MKPPFNLKELKRIGLVLLEVRPRLRQGGEAFYQPNNGKICSLATHLSHVETLINVYRNQLVFDSEQRTHA